MRGTNALVPRAQEQQAKPTLRSPRPLRHTARHRAAPTAPAAPSKALTSLRNRTGLCKRSLFKLI